MGNILAKKYTMAENPVSVDFTPDKFMFTVEPSGSLLPCDILDSALSVLLNKLRAVKEVLETR